MQSIMQESAYDKLSDSLKECVKNYNLLLNAEAEFAGLKGEVETIEKLIADIGEVTYNSKKAIEAARSGYDALDEKLKNAVSNYDLLVSAEKTILTIEAEIKQVEEKIAEIGDITLDKEEAIKSAREAFNALPEQSQNGVKNAKTLVKSEETLAKLKNDIKNVVSMIDNIGDVTLDKESVINSARTAYNSLNEKQKEQVSNYEILVKSRKYSFKA